MRRVRVRRTVPAAAGRVWELLSEFEAWAAWGPSIRAVESAADRVGEGVTGRVQTVARVWLPFRITSVDPGAAWEWEVAGIPATDHRVTALDETSCRVEFSTPWITAPYLAILSRALKNIERLAGHE